MSLEFNLTLRGSSGKEYHFGVFTVETTFNDVGAVYALLKVPYPAFVEADVLYLGKASALGRRLSEHRTEGGKWQSAQKLGFNRIGAFSVATDMERDRVEQDLISSYCPPLNVQHNDLAGLLARGTKAPRSIQNALGDSRDELVNALNMFNFRKGL